MRKKNGRHCKAAGVCVLLCTLWQVGYPVLLAIAHSQFERMGQLLEATGGQPGWEDQAKLENLRESWMEVHRVAEWIYAPLGATVFWVLIAAVLAALMFLYGWKWTAATVGLSLAVSLPAAWLVSFTLSKAQGFTTTSDVWLMRVKTLPGFALALALALFIHWLVLRVKNKSRGQEAL